LGNKRAPGLPAAMAQPVPPELGRFIALNAAYGILVCTGEKCRYALEPAAISRHLRDRHCASIAVRKQADQYAKELPFVYDHGSAQLPADGSAPQPIIPIVDGFACRECPFKTQGRPTMQQHANKAHDKKGAKDEEICRAVRLQSWFGKKRELYWAVDEGQRAAQERRARRVAVQDVGEELDSLGSDVGSGSDSESGQGGNSDDEIIQGIENWIADAQDRRLEALKNVPAAEIDAWLHFTEWNEVFSQSKHNLVKTHQFARPPDQDEPKLERVLRAWGRILERGLNTLASIDHKDALKWWGSPKNEAASQRPFELLQNAQTVEKYSAVWERFIYYILRTAPVENWEDETGE